MSESQRLFEASLGLCNRLHPRKPCRCVFVVLGHIVYTHVSACTCIHTYIRNIICRVTAFGCVILQWPKNEIALAVIYLSELAQLWERDRGTAQNEIKHVYDAKQSCQKSKLKSDVCAA